MIKRTALVVAALVVTLASFSAAPVIAQLDSDKRPLTHDDYDDWKRIQGQRISPDGTWIAYSANPQEGDGELIVRHVASGTEYRHPRGTGARFTADSAHVVFMVAPEEEATEAARKEKTKPEDMPKSALGIMDLVSGAAVEIPRVKGFELPEDAGGWVAYLREGPTSQANEASEEGAEAEEPEGESEEGDDEKAKEKEYGTTLTVRNLATGSEWNAASVTDYIFTKDGGRVIHVVSSEEEPEADGIYTYQPASGGAEVVIQGEGNYERMVVDDGESRLAFVTDRDDYATDAPAFNLYGWTLGSPAAELWVSHTSTPDFPAGLAVSDKSAVSFNDAGNVVMFGIKEVPESPPEDDDEEERAEFDLWSWDDPYPQPQQLVMRESFENQTWESVYHLDSGKFVQLADEDVPDVALTASGNVAFAQTNVPHTKEISFDGRYNDVYVIDPETGERSKVAGHVRSRAQISPGGNYVVWFGHEDYEWHLYDIAKGTTIDLTEGIESRFDQEDHDRPEPANSYGVAGWTDGDGAVLINDRYDIWMVNPDASGARMITDGYGRAYDLAFRYVRLDPDADTIDPDGRMLLRATNQETMATGYWWDSVNGTEYPTQIVMAGKNIGNPTKAKDADVLMYTQMAFDEFPDLWVSGMDFMGKRVSHIGAQMEEFLWGSAELRDFRSADGMPLKGILIKPENFDPNKKYPLLVYIYETLHQGLHSFRNPSPGTSVNASYYVSNDYVMWMPDIEYHTGYPGKDALKCVLPGINMLIEEGLIDPDRIGIQGHSWGGYQISYMVTQTNIFTAAEAGAPVSNMTSAYNGIRWQSGMVRQMQYEQTQSRLGASLWEVPLRYVENSPIFWADKIETPLLILHNDEDGAVPWYQGIEFMMALRRLEKPAWMFNYNGEAHGLRQRVNQEDFTIRMQEFFDHYLKDETPPRWMTEGILAWEKGKTQK